MNTQAYRHDRHSNPVRVTTMTAGIARRLLASQSNVGMSRLRPDLSKSFVMSVLLNGIAAQPDDDSIGPVIANNILRECGIIGKDDRQTSALEVQGE